MLDFFCGSFGGGIYPSKAVALIINKIYFHIAISLIDIYKAYEFHCTVPFFFPYSHTAIHKVGKVFVGFNLKGVRFND